ncbi:MAG: glucose-1-phosphate thymidylyltransferase RfbA [Flavobacteriaceae bacterium]|tara:strand:+ start:29111 stop:29968 length:858 start_codon:yes stop_codon:yes gene_type:complete
MKGIILAGGTGSRLYPMTLSVSKQLLPIYDKPMIYYPLSTLIKCGIKQILIISTINDLSIFKRLLGDGSQWGCCFHYESQDYPKGLADAFIIGSEFIGQSNVALILGDNFFFGGDFENEILSRKDLKGGFVFALRVSNPKRYGVIELDDNFKPVGIEEKPRNPKSPFAIPGIYCYDSSVVSKAKDLNFSDRGELEISDINKAFLKESNLEVKVLSEDTVWLDTGTVDSLMKANQFVETLQDRKGILVGSPELSSYQSNLITKETLSILVESMAESKYGEFLKSNL